ncbi:MAG: transcriptional regulator [Candidatus Solibacter sp.]|nr:transcriptional regulator [Candidatus Solibacter sp.]
MPLYEYRCASCDQVIEVIQKFSDTPLTVHESCGGALERLLGRPALQFKGSGFYITDYKKSGPPSANNGGKSANSESKSESKSEAKSEAKSEPKSDSKAESKPSAAPAKKD